MLTSVNTKLQWSYLAIIWIPAPAAMPLFAKKETKEVRQKERTQAKAECNAAVDRQEEVQTLEIYRIHQNSILDDLRRVATAIYCHPLPLCDALLNSGVVLALYVQVVIPGLCKQD